MKNSITVLMVDDEERFRSTTSTLLTRRGFNTQIAASGEEALDIIGKQRPDVVILDIKMPGMDGHQALAEIKKIDQTIPVIMLTGHGTPTSAEESSEFGAYDYLTKPCDIDLLTAKIHDAVRYSEHVDQETEKSAFQIMIPFDEYTTINQNCTVSEGINKLRKTFEGALSTTRLMETGHRSILVRDDNDNLVGILSIRDLIRALQPPFLNFPKPSMAESLQYSQMFWRGLYTLRVHEIASMKISDIMSEQPISIDYNANLMEIANLMVSKEIRRVTVTKDNKTVGVIREQELFFELANMMGKKMITLNNSEKRD